LQRAAAGAVDGRKDKAFIAAAYLEALDAYLEATNQVSPANVTALKASPDNYEFLVAEHDYPGSLRSVQRYVKQAFPAPAVRARRRVETPPGAQAQADWAHFPGVLVAGDRVDLLAFAVQLSFSRADALIWSGSKNQLAWLSVHHQAFRRLGGVPATVRVDNEKTAVAQGAGAWGVINAAYRRYAQSMRFHIDACPPRSPEAKGKIERRIRDKRSGCSPYARHWHDLAELQARSDECVVAAWRRRSCPATGGSVFEAHQLEEAALTPLGELPEPFEVALTRRVARDCTINFEGRSYSVPFAHPGRPVEVRGRHGTVQILADARVMAVHPRATRERIVLDHRHYEGEAASTVLPPLPLGKMGRKLQEIAALPPEARPIDLYAALAEVAR
jgi:hypothetical protein